LQEDQFAVAVVLGACMLRLRVCARVGGRRLSGQDFTRLLCQNSAGVAQAPNDRARAGTAALPARAKFPRRCLPFGTAQRAVPRSGIIRLRCRCPRLPGALWRSLALSRTLSLLLLLLLTLSRSHALTLSRSHALTLSSSRAHMRTQIHAYKHIQTSVRIYQHTRVHQRKKCANNSTQVCIRARTAHTARHITHARTLARTHVGKHAPSHARSHAHTHTLIHVRSFGRTDGRSLARSLPR
jgi:hypothetical protein